MIRSFPKHMTRSQATSPTNLPQISHISIDEHRSQAHSLWKERWMEGLFPPLHGVFHSLERLRCSGPFLSGHPNDVTPWALSLSRYTTGLVDVTILHAQVTLDHHMSQTCVPSCSLLLQPSCASAWRWHKIRALVLQPGSQELDPGGSPPCQHCPNELSCRGTSKSAGLQTLASSRA